MTVKGSLEYGGLNCPGATTVATTVEAERLEKARRFVASQANDRDDCAKLLDMLGLVPDDKVLAVRVL